MHTENNKTRTICIQTNIAEASNAIIAGTVNNGSAQHSKLNL